MHEAMVMHKLRKGMRREVRATTGNQKLELWWKEAYDRRNDLLTTHVRSVRKQRQPVADPRAVVGDDQDRAPGADHGDIRQGLPQLHPFRPPFAIIVVPVCQGRPSVLP